MKIKNWFLISVILFGLSGRFDIGRLIDVNGIFEIRLLLFVICIMFFLLLCFYGFKMQAPTSQAKLFLTLSCFYMFLLITSCCYSQSISIAAEKVYDIVYLLFFILLSFVVIHCYDNVIDLLNYVFKFFVIVGIIYSIPILISIADGARGSIILGGPNVATRILFFSFASSLSLYGLNDNLKYAVLSGLFVLSLIALGSRGGIGAFLVCVALYLISKINFKKIKIIFSKNTLKFAISLASLFGLFYLTGFLKYTYVIFESRFLNLVFENLYLAGRDYIFVNSIYAILANPIIGYGLNGYKVLFGGVYPHNLFLESMIELGVIGLLIMLLILSFSFKNLFFEVNGKKIFGALIPLYMLLVSQVSGDIYDFRYYFFFVILFIYSCNKLKICKYKS